MAPGSFEKDLSRFTQNPERFFVDADQLPVLTDQFLPPGSDRPVLTARFWPSA
jgi:hypothetical protein